MSNFLGNSSALINAMSSAARKAGRGLIRDFGEIENLQVSKKSLKDFVSTADLRSEKIIIEELGKARPDFNFLTEESGYIEGNDKNHCWIVDPLDGTANFLHGVPYFAVVIALEFKKEIIASLIYSPITEDLFYAEKGKGAFLNQKRIRVSNRKNLEESLLAYNNNFYELPFFANLNKRFMAVRHFGAMALDLAYLATGRYDVVFVLNSKPWDVSAGMLLVKEAGGFISEFNLENSNNTNVNNFFASNLSLKEELNLIIK